MMSIEMRQHRQLALLGILLGLLTLSLTGKAQTDSLRSEMMRGNTSGMESYIKGLSKAKRRALPNRTLLTEIALAHYDLSEASDQLAGIESLRASDAQQSTVEELTMRLKAAERTSSGLVRMQLYTYRTGSEEGLLSDLSREAPSVGQLSRATFVSADGRERWQVVSDTLGHDHLVVTGRLGDGTWDSESEREVEILGLEGGRIAYPYLLADGETISFAYNGPESLGGYDLFISRYDREGGRLLVPQQLPAPYNTLASDYLLLRDEERGVDWLLTDRGTSAPEVLALYALSHRTERQDVVTKELAWMMGDSIMQSGIALPPPVRGAEAKGAGDAREPLFWLGETPVYDQSSLTGRESRHFLEQYTERAERLSTLRTKLESLRKRFETDRSVRGEILELERQEQALERELFDLRNKVIAREKKAK